MNHPPSSIAPPETAAPSHRASPARHPATAAARPSVHSSTLSPYRLRACGRWGPSFFVSFPFPVRVRDEQNLLSPFPCPAPAPLRLRSGSALDVTGGVNECPAGVRRSRAPRDTAPYHERRARGVPAACLYGHTVQVVARGEGGAQRRAVASHWPRPRTCAPARSQRGIDIWDSTHAARHEPVIRRLPRRWPAARTGGSQQLQE